MIAKPMTIPGNNSGKVVSKSSSQRPRSLVRTRIQEANVVSNITTVALPRPSKTLFLMESVIFGKWMAVTKFFKVNNEKASSEGCI